MYTKLGWSSSKWNHIIFVLCVHVPFHHIFPIFTTLFVDSKTRIVTLVVTQYQAQTKTKKLSGITGRDRSLIQLIIKLSDGQSSTAVPIMTINSLGIVLYMVYVTLVVLRKKKLQGVFEWRKALSNSNAIA